MKKILISLALLAAAATAQAKEELLVTVANAGKGVVAEIDFVSPAGETVGFEFTLQVPAGSKPNTASCVKNIPATHKAFCHFDATANVIRGSVYSDINTPLPKGITSIGRVSLVGSTAPEALRVGTFLAAGADASALKSGVRNERLD